MSDVFEGPGYWMASDGKWYAPERHPDANYRARFALPPSDVSIPPSDVTAPGDTGADDTGVDDQIEQTRPEFDVSVDADVSTEPDERSSSDTAAIRADEQQMSRGEFPSVGVHTEASTGSGTSTPLSDIHRTVGDFDSHGLAADVDAVVADPAAEAHVEVDTEDAVAEAHVVEIDADANVERSAAAPSAELAAEPEVVPAFSVASPSFTRASERPVFDAAPPASVVSPPPTGPTPDSGEGTSRVELELRRDPATTNVRSVAAAASARVHQAPGTALAVVTPPVFDATPTVGDRVVAGLIFAGGVAMIVGAFLDWTTGSLVQTGWDRGDGIAAVVAGVIGSAAAGPIYVGYRHVVPKAVAIVCGLIGLVVIGLTAVSVLFDSAAADTSVGAGFIIVFIGSLAMAIAGLADRGELLA